MKVKENKFRFKQFDLRHYRSSMKVGVDAVLLGAWVNPVGRRLLDVGTGCGVIALMLAQRNDSASVFAIDIDSSSIEEAYENFNTSPWADRLLAERISFSDFHDSSSFGKKEFDLIVSNPPFFNAGVTDFSSSRMIARHSGLLSPDVLLAKSRDMLAPDGRLAMIVPYDQFDELKKSARNNGFFLNRALKIEHHEGAPVKRILLEFENGLEHNTDSASPPLLTLFMPDGEPTEDYRSLCKDFYLKF